MEKANQGCTAVFAVAGVFPASPSKGTWQVTLRGLEPSVTAIILKLLFLPDPILWHKRRSLVGATFNGKDTAGALRGPAVPCLISSLSREQPRGLALLPGGPSSLPVPGWLRGVISVPGQRVAVRGGRDGSGRWPQRGGSARGGWGSSELWLLPWAHRFSFSTLLVTAWDRHPALLDGFRNGGDGLRTRLKLVLLQKTVCWGWCTCGHAGNLTFLLIVSHFLSLIWLFSFVGFFAPAN